MSEVCLNPEPFDPARRAASLSKLAYLFGLCFNYYVPDNYATPYVKQDRCLVDLRTLDRDG